MKHPVSKLTPKVAILWWRTIAVVVLAVLVVGGLTAAFSYQFYEPGERWDQAMNHIMFGVVVGPIMVGGFIVFHLINAYLKSRSKNRHQ